MTQQGIKTRVTKDESLVALGQAIRQRRFDAGVSQESLAMDCGLNPSNLGKVERGERNSSTLTLGRIAAALNCRISDLFLSADL